MKWLWTVACCFWFFSTPSVYGLLETQIEEDLAGIQTKVFTSDHLYQRFQELVLAKCQVMYCMIRNNQATWLQSTLKNDSKRHKVIVKYLDTLIKQRPLPDMDFILCTEDGFHEHSPVPMFVFAADKRAKDNLLLFPDHEALAGMDLEKLNQYSARYPWERKVNKGFFRGAGTGKFDLRDKKCFGNDRLRLLMFSCENPSLIEADLTSTFQKEMRMRLAEIHKPLVPGLPIEQHFVYKYLLDVDGHSSTYSRGRWILCSNSVLVKVGSDFTQWYYTILQPYRNYIPVRNDLSDLKEVIAWLETHDAEARQIAVSGQHLGPEIFSKKAIDTYVHQLLTQYAEKIETNKNSNEPLITKGKKIARIR